MNFMLISLRDAFRNIEYQKRAAKFPLFAFVLATTADKNIFPEIMSYYPELNTLTADYMLVVAPQVNMLDRDGNTVTSAAKIASVLSSGRFLNPHSYRYEDFSQEIERFKGEQTQESIKFARFCGIELNKLPCIVFFDTLTRPEEYIIWELHDQDAASVVRDFRLIISEIEEEQSPYVNLKKRRKQLLGQQQQLKSEVDAIKSETNQSISLLKARIRSRRSQISELEKALDNRNKRAERLNKKDENIKYTENGVERILHVPTELARIKGEVKQLQSQIESLQTSLSAEIEAVQKQIDGLRNDESKQIEAIEDQVRDILKRIDSLDKESANTSKPDLLGVISKLKRGKFIRRVVNKAGGVVPLLGLGLSAVEIFDQP